MTEGAWLTGLEVDRLRTALAATADEVVRPVSASTQLRPRETER